MSKDRMLQSKDIEKTFFDINCTIFLRSVTQGNRNKKKNKPIGPNQTYKFCKAKETIKKDSLQMGENSCNQCS